MNLKSLSNTHLHEKLVSISSEERKLTLELLHHLREFDRRKLFAERGHSSLFEYATRELKYSESAAQRRIFAMRALRDLPELESKVESGELKVTQLAQVQSFIRMEQKAGKSFSLSEKKELIESTIGRSTRETEKMLAEKNPESALRDQFRLVTPTQTQITFTADEELMKSLEKVRDRFAHRLPVGATTADVIRFMADLSLRSAPEKREDPRKENLPLPAPVVASRYVPIAVKRLVRKRDEGKCAYVSQVTGKKCVSTHRLEIDHLVPYARGGSSTDPANLRLLCFTHNQAEARRVFRFSYGT